MATQKLRTGIFINKSDKGLLYLSGQVKTEDGKKIRITLFKNNKYEEYKKNGQKPPKNVPVYNAVIEYEEPEEENITSSVPEEEVPF